MFLQQILNPIPAQDPASGVREQRSAGAKCVLFEPAPQGSHGILPERSAALFAALAVAPNMSAGPELDVMAFQADQLRNAQAGLECDVQESHIASPRPGADIRRPEERIHLHPAQKTYRAATTPFRRDCQYALDHRAVRRILQLDVPKERMDGCQSRVPGPNAVSAFLFKVSEKSHDERSVEVRHVQAAGRLAE